MNRLYVDPKGLFSMVPPPGWRVREYPDDVRGKVAFTSPDGREDVRVIAQVSDYASFDELEENTHSRMPDFARISDRTTATRTVLRGRPTMKIVVEHNSVEQHQFLFLLGAVYFNISFMFPQGGVRDDHMREVLESFSPRPTTSQADADKHSIAAKVRRARMFIDMLQWDLAQAALDEGFQIAPCHAQLANLQSELEQKRQLESAAKSKKQALE